jgi:hypothetical protein
MKELLPTARQLKRIQKVIACIGEDRVISYLQKHWPAATLENMNRKQANKIITGMGYVLPRPIIHGIYEGQLH